ncbi:MAG: anti-sigma F factor [Candidatus Merdivicinus sp.]|jgi:stage II sporulation protein AB (anti-sigma F factor)
MKTPLNEMLLTFPSRSANEAFARAAAASFLVQLDPTVEELADIRTAVSEAVTNCIVHAYRNTLGKIRMTVRIWENRRVTIQIKDSGCGIPDVKQAMEPMYTTCETGERAGLGFAVMQSFMDRVTVRSTPGRGTTITLQKTLSSRDEPYEPQRG